MDFELAANSLRFLSIDMVEKAGSGHPGAPMGMADFVTVLFADFLRFDPANPKWVNRDRLILSNGHASTILYSALYLSGYSDISREDLERYREFGSAAAGHPEYRHFGGIEMTTGPLGQGLATGVGMALAERLLHRDHPVIDHHTYVIVGDGCLMEGISYEAAAFAGRQKLSRLVVLFDDNGITIEGSTNLATVEDRGAIFASMGWSVHSADGHDHESVREAIKAARASDRPAFVALRTTIGHGAPSKAGRAEVHGAPLGGEEMAAARKAMGWPHRPFETPREGMALWRSFARRNKPAIDEWNNAFGALSEAERGELARRENGGLRPRAITALQALKRQFADDPKKMPTRKATPRIVDTLVPLAPELIGGSADLGDSNGSRGSTMTGIFPEDGYRGNYIHFGIREHLLAAAMNGFALYGSFKAYGSTYLVFSDYMRPAIRLAALMRIPSIFLYSHDSIGVGPDGPTHQPVEQLASLRSVPNLRVYRPADAVEAAECWELVLTERDTPSVIVTSRQDSAPFRTTHTDENLSARGAYAVKGGDSDRVVLVSSGTDVAHCLEAAAILDAHQVPTGVVSVPCLERFLEQDDGYRASVLARGEPVMRVAVESAIDSGWSRWLGPGSHFIGMTSFGTTGPGEALFKHFGLDGEGIAGSVQALLGADFHSGA